MQDVAPAVVTEQSTESAPVHTGFERGARVVNWLRAHPVEIVFALLCVGAFVYELRITRESWWYLDDWSGIQQSSAISQLLKPYNGSLILVSLLIYRVLLEVFGFDYTPFRVIGLLCLVGVPASYFFTTRRQFGAALAALLALPLLWFGKYVSLFPADLNHNLALICAIVCAAALNHGRRADIVLFVALAVAFASSGEGVAIAAACLIHSACLRAPLRRWIAIVIPTLLWVVWWIVAIDHHHSSLGHFTRTPSQMLDLVRNLAYAAFQSAALGSTVFTVALAAAFIAYGVWTVTRGLDRAANFLAWAPAAAIWIVGLGTTRGVFVSLTVFRYRYTVLCLILLAVVPRRPIVWPSWFPIVKDRRWLLGAAGVILVLGCARGLAVRSDLQADANTSATQGRETRAESVVIGLGPGVTGDTPLGFDWGPRSFLFSGMSASEIRALFSLYGQPFPTSLADADRKIVGLGGVDAHVVGTRDSPCEELTEPYTYKQTKGSTLLFWSADKSFSIDVRRFGDSWVTLRQVSPGHLVAVDFPWLPSAQPWQVRAIGACRAA